MRDSILKNILKNSWLFFKNDIRKENNRLRQQALEQQAAIEDLSYRYEGLVFYNRLMSYYARNQEEASAFLNELNYLRDKGDFCNFPYPDKGLKSEVIAGFDDGVKLPYVLHNGIKLYYPRIWSVDSVKKMYVNYITCELFLETDDDLIAPHQYQSSMVNVKEGDVVFDIGSAEGLFALDNIKKASHIFIVEGDELWMESLRHTFAPYQDKVTIIDKYIGESERESQITIQSLLEKAVFETAFVKMDIEGSELPCLTSARAFLQAIGKKVKFSCAAYHRQNDAEEIKLLFDSIGYQTEFSNGYMLFNNYDTPIPPFFRHGIVRAIRK